MEAWVVWGLLVSLDFTTKIFLKSIFSSAGGLFKKTLQKWLAHNLKRNFN
jgi:hypothetical protein